MNRREFLRTAGGAAGAAAAAGAGASSASGQDGPPALQGNQTQAGGNQTAPGNETAAGNQTGTGNQTQGGTGGTGPTETVAVGPNGNYVFDPAELPIQPGTTVIWEWESDNHNIAPQSIPDGATWEGHPEIVGTGSTYQYTFEVEGTYEYLCEPHEAADMEGVIEVTTDAGGGGGGGGGHEEVEPAEMGVQIQKHFVGAAAFMGIFSTLVFVFYLLKYGESAHTSAPGKRD